MTSRTEPQPAARRCRIFLHCLLLCLPALPATVPAADSAETIIIDRNQIRSLNVQRIADILNRVPGVRAGDTSVSIRGSSRVRVLLDGRPINDPTSSHGRVNFDFITPENIEQIEILPGRGALQYGTDASGGVILITSRSLDALRGNLKVYGGNLDTGSASGEINLQQDGWNISTSLGWDQTDGYQMNNDKKKKRIGTKISRDHDGLTSSLMLNYLQERRGIPGRPEYPTPFARKRRDMFSSALNLRLATLNSDTFLNRADTGNTNPERALDTFITVTELGEDITASFPTRRLGTIHTGIGGRWGLADASGFSNQREHSLFSFIADTWSLPRLPVQLSVGLRATTYSLFADTVNPEIKLSMTRGGEQIALSWTRSSNTPSLYQRYDETSTRLPNPELNMETANNYSLSLTSKFTESFSLGLALFYNRINDRITYVLDDSGVGRYENFGHVTYRGADLQLTWKLNSSFSVKGAYSYLRAMDEDTGLRLAAKPRHRMNTDLEFRTAQLPVSTIFNIKYESKQATRSDNTTWEPQRWLFGIRSEYRQGTVRFFAEIKNMTNITCHYGDGSLASPRTWVAGIKMNF